MTLTEAERAVVIARRRKKHAMPGMKEQRAVELKHAVTEALRAYVARAQTRSHGDEVSTMRRGAA